MAFVDWNSNYTVYDQEMDAHHQCLFSIVNDLHSAVYTKKGKVELEKIIARLLEHTKTHFAAEERLMQARNYPHYALHKAEHERLLKQVLEIEKEFRASQGERGSDMLAFLIKDWVIGHILKFDKDYSGKYSTVLPAAAHSSPRNAHP